MSHDVLDPGLLDGLDRNADDFAWVATAVAPHQDDPVGGGWTPRQQLFHLWMVEREVHQFRITAALENDEPAFLNWDEAAAMLAHWPIEEDIQSLVVALRTRRNETLALLRSLTPEQLRRTAIWPDGMIVDVAWIATRAYGHALEHLATLVDTQAALEHRHAAPSLNR